MKQNKEIKQQKPPWRGSSSNSSWKTENRYLGINNEDKKKQHVLVSQKKVEEDENVNIEVTEDPIKEANEIRNFNAF